MSFPCGLLPRVKLCQPSSGREHGLDDPILNCSILYSGNLEGSPAATCKPTLLHPSQDACSFHHSVLNSKDLLFAHRTLCPSLTLSHFYPKWTIIAVFFGECAVEWASAACPDEFCLLLADLVKKCGPQVHGTTSLWYSLMTPRSLGPGTMGIESAVSAWFSLGLEHTLQDRSSAEALPRKSLPGAGEWLSRDPGSSVLKAEDLACQSQRRLSEGVGEATGIEERNEVVQADKLLQSPGFLLASCSFKISNKIWEMYM